MLAMAHGAERRKASRYHLQLPVLFIWHDGHEIHTQGGFTRDVSVQGLYVTSSVAPPVRTAVNVEVFLPASLGQMPENTIKAPGYVVRMSGPSEPRGFAIAAQLGTDFGVAENYRPQ